LFSAPASATVHSWFWLIWGELFALGRSLPLTLALNVIQQLRKHGA